MKSISIYALTRKQNIEHLQKLEQQLSGREHMLKMKEWELESMRALVERLELHMQDVSADRKSTRLNSSHRCTSRMPSSA